MNLQDTFDKLLPTLAADLKNSENKQAVKLDNAYSLGKRKHRNRLEAMNHAMDYVIHPLTLAAIIIILGLSLCVCHAVPCTATEHIADDIQIILSYGGCAFITYILTSLFQNKRKNSTSSRLNIDGETTD
jgi:hypothetical protein